MFARLWVKTNGIPLWGRCTHFGTNLSGWIEMFTGGTIGLLTHVHLIEVSWVWVKIDPPEKPRVLVLVSIYRGLRHFGVTNYL